MQFDEQNLCKMHCKYLHARQKNNEVKKEKETQATVATQTCVMPWLHSPFLLLYPQTLDPAFKSLKPVVSLETQGRQVERKWEETQPPLDRYTQMRSVYPVWAAVPAAEYANEVPQRTFFFSSIDSWSEKLRIIQAEHNRKRLICLVDRGVKT